MNIICTRVKKAIYSLWIYTDAVLQCSVLLLLLLLGIILGIMGIIVEVLLLVGESLSPFPKTTNPPPPRATYPAPPPNTTHPYYSVPFPFNYSLAAKT